MAKSETDTERAERLADIFLSFVFPERQRCVGRVLACIGHCRQYGAAPELVNVLELLATDMEHPELHMNIAAALQSVLR